MTKQMSATIANLINDAIVKRENATARVDRAIRDGKLVPEQRAWGISYCSKYPRGFETFIAAAPRMEIEGNNIFIGRAGNAPEDQLTRTELMVAQKMGITAEQFAQAKAKRTQAQ